MPKFVNALIVVVILVVLGFLISRLNAPPRASLPSSSNTMPASIPLDQIYDGGPGKDGIPSIDNPKFESVTPADAWIDPEGLGLAVSLDGVDRYYPYQILVWHEIVNDTVAGKPLAVTFCPLCGSGLVFDRTLEGRVYEFGVSGKLYQSDLLMYDRKIDGNPGTESYWTQITGEAVVGSSTGKRLEQLTSLVVPWSEWKQQHPNGEVLSRETGHRRNYGANPYGDYDQSSSIYFPVGNKDSRLNPKTRVIGVTIENSFKAYVRDDVLNQGSIEDTLSGQTVRLQKTADGGVEVLIDGNKTLHVELFWFAWAAFHPDTELYQP